MFSMKKKITNVLIVVIGFSCFTSQSMEQEIQRTKQEDKRIRQILRNLNKTETILALVAQAQKGNNTLDRYKIANDTLISFNSKNKYISINDNENDTTYQRQLKRFIELCKETSGHSDDEDNEKNDTFEHSNREDYSSKDDGQLLAKQESKKKCCCDLI